MHTVPPVADRTLLNVLRRGLEHHPDSPAISDDSIELTYRELWERASRVAGGLAAAGVRNGDSVLSMLENSADCFVLMVATSFLGAPLTPINLAWGGAHLAHAIREAGCVAAVVDEHLVDTVQEADGGGLRTLVVRSGVAGAAESARQGLTWSGLLEAEPVEPIEAGPDTVLAIIFTSGTTGRSKGVLTTHAQAFTMCAYSPHPWELATAARWYVPAPMFHALGLFGGTFAPLIVGGSAHIASSFSPSRFWDEVNACGANFVFLIGPMADFILAQPPLATDRNHRLTLVNIVPRTPSATAFSERFGVRTTTAFGQSECGTVFADWTGTVPPRSVGIPREGVEVRLIDAQGRDVVDGEAGQLIVRPEEPCVLTPGYVNDPEATAAIWQDGWYHSGDVMRRDENGLYYFVDRLKDSIRRRGENISSVEVEMGVLTHPDVLECAVLGVGDVGEQEVLAVVVRADDATISEADLVLYLVDHLPYYAVPRYIVFAEQLPRTQTGKVQKTAIRAMEFDPWDREAAGITVRRPERPTRR